MAVITPAIWGLVDIAHRISHATRAVLPTPCPEATALRKEASHEGNSSEDAEIGERLKRALLVLNARQKEALYLRFQLGLSYEEVSKLLGINYQSTRNLIHRSIVKVRMAADQTHYSNDLKRGEVKV